MRDHATDLSEIRKEIKQLRDEVKTFAAITELADRVSQLEARIKTQNMAHQQYLEAVMKNINTRMEKLEQ